MAGRTLVRAPYAAVRLSYGLEANAECPNRHNRRPGAPSLGRCSSPAWYGISLSTGDVLAEVVRVISRKVPWRKSEWEKSRRDRPWGPQALAVVVVVLALVLIYQGTMGRQVLSSLETYLGGAQPTSGTAKMPPGVDGQGGVDSLQALLASLADRVKHTDWSGATEALSTLEDNWLNLQTTFSRAGVRPQDLNTITADISELALAVAAKNQSDALAQIRQAQRELDWITANYLNGSAPTMEQMSTVIQDLNQAVAAKNWSRVQQDAQTLQNMMRALQRGF